MRRIFTLLTLCFTVLAATTLDAAAQDAQTRAAAIQELRAKRAELTQLESNPCAVG